MAGEAVRRDMIEAIRLEQQRSKTPGKRPRRRRKPAAGGGSAAEAAGPVPDA